jgi:hypothetical protein
MDKMCGNCIWRSKLVAEGDNWAACLNKNSIHHGTFPDSPACEYYQDVVIEDEEDPLEIFLYPDPNGDTDY